MRHTAERLSVGRRGGVIATIVSGGQTGADRSAWDVALELGIAIGGWIPRGRRAEDGLVPERYEGLAETDSASYESRTKRNVRDSDATLIFAFGPPTGGTALTEEVAHQLGKPVLTVDLERCSLEESVAAVRDWLSRTRPRVLNVAGPRLSQEPRIAEATSGVLRQALRGTSS